MPSVFDYSQFLKTVPSEPGVYRMYDAQGEVIYVGKARRLSKRLASYFNRQHDDTKTASLVAHIDHIEFTITPSEPEALLLENNLIKEYKPRYNVLLRDDKSYPYLYLSTQELYPRLVFVRGTPKGKGKYFGPYPSTGAVRDTLALLQKLFLLRQCDNTFFKNRSRPCLQYQIKRCSAPCVQLITPQAYDESVQQTIAFLQGKDTQIIQSLVEKMDAASRKQDYESAAHYRDLIAKLRTVQSQQSIYSQAKDTDVMVYQQSGHTTVVEVLYIRQGKLMGNRTFFPKVPKHLNEAEGFASFIAQHYFANPGLHGIPYRVITNLAVEDQDLLSETLHQAVGHQVGVTQSVRGVAKQWLKMASLNATASLKQHLAHGTALQVRFEALQTALGLPTCPERIECFDISHTQGEATVASCVVYGLTGPLKSDYRRFNIKDITPGDDYAAMHQALTRRYKRLKEGEGKLPDILLIDGGKGQLTQAKAVLTELQVLDVVLVGIAKGEGRKPGLETLFTADHPEGLHLEADSPALHVLQAARDEAHRFAITGHRGQRAKARKHSTLEDIPGLGPVRRRNLLNFFGGLQEIKKASIEELAKTPGISEALATEIFRYLHQD